jgi:hypothetical protein
MRHRSSFPTFFAAALLVAALASCGKKPDGTPYGVDPARLPEGRQAKAKSAATMYKQDVPKGAELKRASPPARRYRPRRRASRAAGSGPQNLPLRP